MKTEDVVNGINDILKRHTDESRGKKPDGMFVMYGCMVFQNPEGKLLTKKMAFLNGNRDGMILAHSEIQEMINKTLEHMIEGKTPGELIASMAKNSKAVEYAEARGGSMHGRVNVETTPSRDDVMDFVQRNIESGNIGVLPEGTSIEASGVVVVTLAETFSPDDDKRVWRSEINRSAPRDVDCAGCGKQVVMSNGMYARLTSGQFTRQQVKCGGCAGLLPKS